MRRPILLRWIAAAFLAVALVLRSSSAEANGRFPEANQILFSDTDPNYILLRATFGVLASSDRGKTFDWICEAASETVGNEDTMFALTSSDALVGSTLHGITTSRDRGCNWSRVRSEERFVDLARSRDGRTVVAISTAFDRRDDAGNSQFANAVWASNDDGRTFARVGAPLDPTLLLDTIDLTATDPNRVYVSAIRLVEGDPLGILLTSADRGETWTEITIPLSTSERTLYIAAVDPTNAERVYLRTASARAGRPTHLLLREAPPDGGASATVREIYTATGALTGFAISPDGKRVFIGGAADGLITANTTDHEFRILSSMGVSCLAFSAEGLWACADGTTGFNVGLSTDEGRTFAPKMRLCDVRGVLSCPPGSSTERQCANGWEPQRSQLGCNDAGLTPFDAGKAADGGQAVTTFTAGGAGCGCNSAVSPTHIGGVLVALVVFLRAFRRRNR